jgi:1-acyl-sn-glycerol-3-phosphate acyltransferase
VRPAAYDFVAKLAHLILRLFFRRVEVEGLENLPKDGGGILVSWHPNGMIDPLLIFETFPRQVVFGARHGLFDVPLMGWIMRAVGTVPIYRAMDAKGQDPEARRQQNQKSLDALADRVKEGSFTCLFPEGDSHDAPHLIELKTGVARFYYRSRQLMAPGAPPPVIVPVGLHYDQKRLFRSNVLVSFHPPIALEGTLDVTPAEDEEEAIARDRARALTEVIEHTLTEAVHATESWELHHLMHRCRKIARAERASRANSELAAPSMVERARATARVWKGYYARLVTHPKQTAALVARVKEYDADLRALGMEDHELDRGPALVKAWLAILLVLQALLVYFLLPPLMIFGAIVNAPPALLLWSITLAAAKKKKDEASIKVLAGALIFPLTWITISALAAIGHARAHAMYAAIPDTPILAGFVVGLLAFTGGAVAMRYLRLARETARAVRVRLTRERRRLTIARLRVDRGELFEELVTLADGLELPGSVQSDGTIGPTLPPGEPAPA